MTIIDGLAYTGATGRAKSQMLPTNAGIYIWTFQLARSFDGLRAAAELDGRVSGAFGRFRTEHPDEGMAGHFRRVVVHDAPPALTDASVQRLDGLLKGGMTDFSWLLTAGTLFQRPLYVGKALNFRTRLPAHFGYRTSFSKKLREVEINFNELAVTLLHLNAEGYVPYPEDEANAEDEQDAAEEIAAESSIQSLGEMDVADEVVPPGREDQDRLIKLCESLIIRNLQPVFNVQVE